MTESKKGFTDLNIARIESFLDDTAAKELVQSRGPVFASLEISINGACNIRCFFCPREDKEAYPNIGTPMKLQKR